MKPERIVQQLTDAVKKIGYRVRIEEGNFRGGSCILAEERMVILNRRMSQEERAEILGRVLASEDLDAIFLLPQVRAYIEKITVSQEPAVRQEELPGDSAAPETPRESPGDAAQ